MLVVLSLAAILTGCSSASDLDVFGIFDAGPAAPATTGQSSVRAGGDAASTEAGAQRTPKLSSVPARPQALTPSDVRQRVVDGLAADRENAQYSDQSIRLQGTSREEPAATTTTTPPPPSPLPPAPQIGPKSDLGAGSPAQFAASVSRVQTARATRRPVPVPIATGPRPSVVVDPTAISTSSGSPLTPERATIDEQVATIQFNRSSTKLSELDRRIIAEVASAQRQNDAEVIVIGHASGRTRQLDSVDRELANFRISLARANRVATQLIAMGVAQEKVRVEAAADGDPRYSEAMPNGEAGNRRADIYFRQ